MSIPETIRRFLDAHLIDYDVLVHPRTDSPLSAARAAYLSPAQVVHAVALRDRRGLVVAVFPTSHSLDLEALNRQLDRDLLPMDPMHTTGLFADCEPGLVPVVSGAYGVKAIIDDFHQDADDIYFEATRSELVRIRKRDLERIQSAWHGRRISRPNIELHEPAGIADPPTPQQNIRQCMQKIAHLPAMPDMAQRILQLRANPYADSQDLARIVELDPSLAAQVMRYARSPFFGYRGEITSAQEAISRVLGYELTTNILLGIALGKSFRNSSAGPLGLDAFWQHAIYCAALTQCLAKSVPHQIRPKTGLAYLAGLLHNMGILLVGHLFQAEFYWLNKQVESRPDIPLQNIEDQLLGVTHMEMGALLLEHWKLNSELVISAKEHHNESYVGLHASYAHLVLTANRLLKRVGIGDAESTELPADVLQHLGLSEEQAEQVLSGVLEAKEGLDGMASQMAA